MQFSQDLKPNPDFIFTASGKELISFALTTPLDSLFYLCLNILRVRGDAPALAEVRQRVEADEESLDRRFAVARACNDASGALDLVTREGGVIAMVPDLIMASHQACRLPPLLNYCVEKQSLQSWYRPIAGFHALLNELTRSAPGELRAKLDILPREYGDLTDDVNPETKKIRLTGIAKVHNEGRRVLRVVQSMLDFCDDVVLWDHRSDDGSIDDLERLPRAERNRLEVIRSTSPEYNERIIYDELFSRARQRKATHICHFDADEILSCKFSKTRLRQVAARLHPGDVASIELVQLVGAQGDYIDYSNANGLAASQYYLPQWRDFLFADDGHALHAQTHLHGGWLPNASLKRRTFLDPAQVVNFHMDKPDANTAKIKNDWYKAKELVLHRFPVEKLIYRYMFYALTYEFMSTSLGRRPPVDARIDAETESKRTDEKQVELRHWLTEIKAPLEKWLFFYA